jgi:hypothetical protein
MPSVRKREGFMNDDRIIRIENKIDSVKETLSDINVTLAAQHESLKDHIRRTELLESTVEPLKKHVAAVSGALRLLGLVVGAFAIMESAVVLLEYLRK